MDAQLICILGLGIAGFLLLIAGLIAFPKGLPSFPLCLPPTDSECSGSGGAVTVGGSYYQVSPFEQYFLARIHERWTFLLAVCWFVSLGLIFATVLPLWPSFMFGTLFSPAYRTILFLVAIGVAGIAAQWCKERWELRIFKVALGSIQSVTSDDAGSKIMQYDFFDSNGERRGGVAADLSGRHSEDLVIVIYNPRDPDDCRAARGLFFHEVVLEKIGARASQKASV